jgi:regulatory protein
MTDELAGDARPPRRGRGRRSEGPRGTVHDRALRLLAVRDRSRREMERRLLQAGFEPEAVAGELERLDVAGLLDDERFARALVEAQVVGRGAGRRAARDALLAKGVSRDLAERAVADAAGTPEDEEARAEALARRRARTLGSVDPAAAFRRLHGLLVRRGYDPGMARTVATRVLAVDEPPD